MSSQFAPRSRREALKRYALSVLATFLAMVLTMQMPDVERNAFYTFFVAAVAVSAYIGGWTAGLLSTVLATLFSVYYMIPPTNSFEVHNPYHLARLFGFLATALLVISLNAALRRSRMFGESARLAVERLEIAQREAKIWNWEYEVGGRVTWEDVLSRIPVRRYQEYSQWLARVHEDDRTSVSRQIDEALQSGEFEAKYRFRFEKDTYLLVLTRAVAQYREGTIQKLAGFTMDVQTAVPAKA